MEDQTRNLNPTAEGLMAMYLYNERYAAGKGGSMDFYDSLSDAEKKTVHACVESVVEAYNRDAYQPMQGKE